MLTDNSRAFNQHRFGHTSSTEAWLAAQGIRPISGSIKHPQTQGKVERSHQPVEAWLARRPATTLEELNATLAALQRYYNNDRQHQGHGIGITPITVWDSIAKDGPLDQPIDLDDFVRPPTPVPAGQAR